MREVVCGPFHSGHRELWARRLAEAVREMRGATCLYLVPTRGLAGIVRQRVLQGLPGVAGEQVLTLFEVVETILHTSEKSYIRLDRLGAERLLANVLRGLTGTWKGEPLAKWSQSPGVVAAFRQHIGELKRAMVTPETLLQKAGQGAPEEELRVLAAVYQAYQRELHAGEYILLDTEETYREAARILREKGLQGVFPGVETVFIDSFTDFQPHQMEVVLPLLQAQEVRVFLPYQLQRWSWMEGIAGQMRGTVDRFLQAGLQVRYVEEEVTDGIAPDLLHVQAQMFAPHPQALKQVDHVRVFGARTEEKEWLSVAKQIKKLHGQGVALHEMALLTQRPLLHGSIGHRVLKREGIPVQGALSLTADTVPWVRDLLALYTVADEEYHRDVLRQLADADWLLDDNPLRGRETALTQVAKQLGIVKGLGVWRTRLTDALEREKWLEERTKDGAGAAGKNARKGQAKQAARQKDQLDLFDFGVVADDQPDLFEGMIEEGNGGGLTNTAAVSAWLERLVKKVHALPREATGAQHVEALRKLLPGQSLYDRFVQQFRDVEGYTVEYLQRDLRAREALEEVLTAIEKMEPLLATTGRASTASTAGTAGTANAAGSSVTYTRREFVQLLWNHLQAAEIVIERGNRAGVAYLNPSAARGLSFRHVFFVGLNEGEWPTPAATSWLLRESLREELAGTTALLTPQVQAEQQKLFFLMGLHTASEGMHFSYVSASKQDLPSRYLDQLFDICPTLKAAPQTDDYLGGSALYPQDRSALSNQRETRDWLAAQLAEGVLAAEAMLVVEPDFWRQVLGQAVSEWERATAGGVSRYDGRLLNSDILRELDERYSKEQIYSVSQFNRYGECGYKFYLSRVLRLDVEQEEEAEFSALEKGNLYHKVLQRLYKGLTDVQAITTAKIEELRAQIDSIFEEEWSRSQMARRTEVGMRQLLEKDRISRRLHDWFEMEAKAWEELQVPLVPRYLEWNFGMKDMKREDDEETANTPHRGPVTVGGLKFRGQIDRIDATQGGEFFIVDYKTKGTKSIPKDIENGVDFQLPVYLRAVEQALFPNGKPVGAAYFSIEKADRKGSAMVKEEYHAAFGMGRKHKIDDEHWNAILATTEETLQAYRQQMAGGEFPVVPSDEKMCAYCDYKRICRYDRIRNLQRAAENDAANTADDAE